MMSCDHSQLHQERAGIHPAKVLEDHLAEEEDGPSEITQPQRARGFTWRKTKMSWVLKDLEVVVLVVPDRVVGRVDQEQCKMASARVKA